LNGERYYQDVVQVADTEDPNLANQLLAQGLELLAIKDHTRQTVQEGKSVIESVPLYILGKLRKAEPAEPADPSKVDLAGLSWRQSKFSDEVESVPPDKIPSATKNFLLEHGSRFEDDVYSYTLSPKGWLNRRKRS
jgi:hypothetical protein